MSILTPDEIQECMTAARKVMGQGRDLEGCFAAEIEGALLRKLSTSKIKTWRERVPVGYESCDKYEAMQGEIADLRVALAYEKQEVELLTDVQRLLIERANKATQKVYEEKDINWKLKVQLQELNLQYISDFGQLQEREPVGTVASLFDESVINHCGFNRDQLVYLSPKPKE